MHKNKTFKKTFKNFALPEVKRFYIEGCVLKYDCSECNKTLTYDLGDDYLSFPENNSIHDFTIYCDNCFGENEVSFKFDFSVTVSEVNQ